MTCVSVIAYLQAFSKIFLCNDLQQFIYAAFLHNTSDFSFTFQTVRNKKVDVDHPQAQISVLIVCFTSIFHAFQRFNFKLEYVPRYYEKMQNVLLFPKSLSKKVCAFFVSSSQNNDEKEIYSVFFLQLVWFCT